MDKQTLSNYGWIVIAVLVLVVMIALATPFGTFVSEAVQSTTQGMFDTSHTALSQGLQAAAGVTVEKPEFENPAIGGNGTNNGNNVNGGNENVTPEAKEMIKFSIEDVGEFEVEEGTRWGEWIASYGISAGDNGIVWIGYDNHQLMEHGYLYVLLDGGILGENQIMIARGEYPTHNDVILPIEYLVDGPK